jgi:hypothetical protein
MGEVERRWETGNEGLLERLDVTPVPGGKERIKADSNADAETDYHQHASHKKRGILCFILF